MNSSIENNYNLDDNINYEKYYYPVNIVDSKVRTYWCFPPILCIDTNCRRKECKDVE